MSKPSVPTCHAGAWRNQVTNTAVKNVRKQDLRMLRLRASVITKRVPSQSENRGLSVANGTSQGESD
jgi:hypothetical protein